MIAPHGEKISSSGLEPPQQLEIGEKLVWKFPSRHQTDKVLLFYKNYLSVCMYVSKAVAKCWT